MKDRRVVVGVMIGVMAVASLVAAAPMKKHAARVSVSGQIKKTRESSKDEKQNSSTKVKSETQFYDLEITVANTIKKPGTFDLEWYFFKRDIDAKGDESDPILCERNEVTLEIGGMKRVKHKLKSAELICKETKTNKTSNRKSSSSTSNKTCSGSIYEGYVLLVKNDGQVVAKYADEKKLLTPKWLACLNGPVKSGSARAKTPKNKKKKK